MRLFLSNLRHLFPCTSRTRPLQRVLSITDGGIYFDPFLVFTYHFSLYFTLYVFVPSHGGRYASFCAQSARQFCRGVITVQYTMKYTIYIFIQSVSHVSIDGSAVCFTRCINRLLISSYIPLWFEHFPVKYASNVPLLFVTFSTNGTPTSVRYYYSNVSLPIQIILSVPTVPILVHLFLYFYFQDVISQWHARAVAPRYSTIRNTISENGSTRLSFPRLLPRT